MKTDIRPDPVGSYNPVNTQVNIVTTQVTIVKIPFCYRCGCLPAEVQGVSCTGDMISAVGKDCCARCVPRKSFPAVFIKLSDKGIGGGGGGGGG